MNVRLGCWPGCDAARFSEDGRISAAERCSQRSMNAAEYVMVGEFEMGVISHH